MRVEKVRGKVRGKGKMGQAGKQDPNDKYDARNPGVRPYKGSTDLELEREQRERRQIDAGKRTKPSDSSSNFQPPFGGRPPKEVIPMKGPTPGQNYLGASGGMSGERKRKGK